VKCILGGATVIAPFACLEPWDRCACLGEAGSSLGVKDSRLGIGPALRMFGRWALVGSFLNIRQPDGLRDSPLIVVGPTTHEHPSAMARGHRELVRTIAPDYRVTTTGHGAFLTT
jgi:hypothetical protein